jgi:hypothetical protein
MIKLSNSKLFFDPTTQNFWLQGPGGGPDLDDDPIEPGDYDYKRTIQKLSNSDKSAVKKSMRGKGNWKESINEDDLGLTYKKGKTIKVTHKKSGKELIIIDKPNAIKKYEKLGFYAESVNEGKFSTQMVNQAVGIAFHYRDNMTKAVKAIEKMKKVSVLKRYIGDESEVEYKDIPLQIFKKLFGDPKKIKVKPPGAIDVKSGKVTVYAESVTENQKRQATDIAVKFDKAYLNFSREIRDIIKMVVRITGNNTDGKIFNSAYKKHLIPFDALFKSWYKGQQDNPHIKESVNEGRYHDYRNDESLSPKQKIGRSMREVRDGLNNLENLVKMNVKLKNELNVNSQSYWKNTHKALNKISERLVKLANKVGQLQ